jgi:hypothetical protein
MAVEVEILRRRHWQQWLARPAAATGDSRNGLVVEVKQLL